MMKVLIAVSALLALAACKNEGTKTGLTFQDCEYVAANEREDFAKATKGMTRNDAIAYVAAQKGVTTDQAAACFK
jgi:uncharacterized lipoprotein NlpE involved in copper resistance